MIASATLILATIPEGTVDGCIQPLFSHVGKVPIRLATTVPGPILCCPVFTFDALLGFARLS